MNARKLLWRAVIALGLSLTACGGDPEPKPTEPEVKLRKGPDEPFRKERPQAGEPGQVTLPGFQKAELKNGLTLMVVEEHSLPIVDVRVVLTSGSALDGKKPGLANMTYAMLDEGAGDMSAVELAEAFSALGTTLQVGNDREAGVVSVRLLRRNLEAGLELLSTVVQKPSFPKDAFERQKSQVLAGLVAQKGNPRAVVAETAVEVAYGKDHPYGQPGSGTEASVGKISVNDVKKFFKSNFGPKAASLVFAGDVTLEDAQALADKVLGKWRGKAKRPKAPAAPKPPTTKIHFVQVAPGSPQTVIWLGRSLIAAGDPDEIKLDVMNQVLGGMFSSRLNMNLREDKAWSYGAFSFVDARNGPGPFIAGANVVAPHTADAVKEFFAEFDKMRTTEVSDQELALAKDNIIKSLPGKFETISAMGQAATELFVYSRPLDHFEKLLEGVKAVTKEDVKAAAERALATEGLTVVLVGDAAAHKDAVDKLGLFEVVVSAPGDDIAR